MDIKTIRFLKILSTGLVIAAMIFAFLIAGIRIFGVQVYGVLTGSMEPSYPTGSLIYVKRVDAIDLRVNDVITFSISPNVIATHRIVEILPDETNPTILRYRTKGDANDDVDASLVSASNIIGKVMFAVPQMGYIANFIQQPPGIYVAIVVCGLMIAFVFYADSLDSKKRSYFQRSTRRGGYGQQKRPQMQQPAQRRANPQQRGHQQQRGYGQQRGYSQQGEYPRQRNNAERREYPQQRDYSRQSGYPQQRGYSEQSGYPQQRGYSEQRGYPQQGSYSEQRGYPQQRGYSQHREYPQQRESAPRREYPQQRNNRINRE